METSSFTTVYRRNGKLQSCEPCRKRKLACNHAVPTCSRCQKAGRASQCSYSAAPLTKTNKSPYPNTSGRKELKSPPKPPAASLLATPQSTPRPALVTRDQYSSACLGDQTNNGRTFTATAVVEQLNDNLGVATAKNNATKRHVSAEEIERGVSILKSLPELSKLDHILDAWCECRDGEALYGPVYRLWWSEMSSCYQGLLGGNSFELDSTSSERPGTGSLHDLSTLIWHNSLTPLHCDGSMSVKAWALQATGANLRWETLGLLFSFIASFFASKADFIFRVAGLEPSDVESSTITEQMSSLAQECIQLCLACKTSNELLITLLLEQAVLFKLTRGETSNDSWLRLGEVCEHAIMLGLHKEKRVDAHTPFFLCELRLRLFSRIYANDKLNSTSLGRPPRITLRWCSLQLPHDLTDAEVCLPEPELKLVLAKLEDGWNPTGSLRRVSWFRVRTQHTILREEILEVALGSCEEELKLRVQSIRAKVACCLEHLPAWARANPEETMFNSDCVVPGRAENWRKDDVLHLGVIHSWKRQTAFLLERAVVNRWSEPPVNLVASARDLLELALQIAGLKSHFKGTNWELDVLLAFYALPPAGVLALELLAYDKDPNSWESPFPRSEIVQQLSVLAHMLGSIGRKETEYEMCASGLKSIQRFLDMVLSPSYQRSTLASMATEEPKMVVEPDWGFTVEDADFLQWLGNSDFNDGDWQGFVTNDFA